MSDLFEALEILADPAKLTARKNELKAAQDAYDRSKAEALAVIELTAPVDQLPALVAQTKVDALAAKQELAAAKEKAKKIIEKADLDAAQIVASAQDKALADQQKRDDLLLEAERTRKDADNELFAVRNAKSDAQEFLNMVDAQRSELNQAKLEAAKQTEAANDIIARYDIKLAQLQQKVSAFVDNLRGD